MYFFASERVLCWFDAMRFLSMNMHCIMLICCKVFLRKNMYYVGLIQCCFLLLFFAYEHALCWMIQGVFVYEHAMCWMIQGAFVYEHALCWITQVVFAFEHILYWFDVVCSVINNYYYLFGIQYSVIKKNTIAYLEFDVQYSAIYFPSREIRLETIPHSCHSRRFKKRTDNSPKQGDRHP